MLLYRDVDQRHISWIAALY